ncbi:glycosyltransferase family 4 protein [Chloroflexota bacterium]
MEHLSICILAPPDAINVKAAARSVFVEIYDNYLPRFGHSVSWVLPVRKGEDYGSQRRDNIYPVSYSKGSFLPVIAINRILLSVKKARVTSRLFRSNRFHLVQAGDNLLDGIAAYYLKKRFKTPYVLKRDDILEKEWYSTLKGYKFLYPAIVLITLFNNLAFRWAIRAADLLLVTSKIMVERLARQGVPRDKIMVLPRGANIEIFSPAVNGKEVRKKYNLAEHPVILYLGTTSRIRQLDIILRAFARVREQKEAARLLIVGDGSKEYLKDIAASLGLGDNVLFTGLVPYSEVPRFIAAADIALCPVPPLDIYTVSSPTKLFEYMAVAKPVIANKEIPEHKEVLEQSGGGILVPFTEESFAKAITELLDNPKRAAEMGQRGRKWVEKTASYEILARQVEARYLELINSTVKRPE